MLTLLHFTELTDALAAYYTEKLTPWVTLRIYRVIKTMYAPELICWCIYLHIVTGMYISVMNMSTVTPLRAELWPPCCLKTGGNDVCDALKREFTITLTKLDRMVYIHKFSDEFEHERCRSITSWVIPHIIGSLDKFKHEPHTSITSRVMALWFLKNDGKLGL